MSSAGKPTTTPPAPRRNRRRVKVFLLVMIVVPFVVVALVLAFVLEFIAISSRSPIQEGVAGDQLQDQTLGRQVDPGPRAGLRDQAGVGGRGVGDRAAVKVFSPVARIAVV